MAKITFIGSGKTATSLGTAFAARGHSFSQVWSRTEEGASILANTLGCTYTTQLNEINGESDIFLIAVADDGIAEIASQINVGDKIIAHTSGVKSKDLLKPSGPNYGILYPFVSMTKESSTDFKNVLLMIEGSNDAAQSALRSIASSISDHVKEVGEGQRQSLHLAAVFANNFTNHLYAIAEKILTEKGMSFDELRPLIAAHLSNVLKSSPSQLQTGPAIRGDRSTIQAHLDLLGHNIEWKQLYLALTESIRDMYKVN